MPCSDRSRTRNSARAILPDFTGDFHNKIGHNQTHAPQQIGEIVRVPGHLHLCNICNIDGTHASQIAASSPQAMLLDVWKFHVLRRLNAC